MRAFQPPDEPREFDRVEILCPDDRWHKHLSGALQIRIFAGVARSGAALTTLRMLQTRFENQPGVRTVNIRRHLDCGFRLRPGETSQSLAQHAGEISGETPLDLRVFDDPAVDIRSDIEAVSLQPWLPGTLFRGYITDIDTFDSELVDSFQVPWG